MMLTSHVLPVMLLIVIAVIVILSLIKSENVSLIRRIALTTVVFMLVPALMVFKNRIVLDDDVMIGFNLGDYIRLLIQGDTIGELLMPIQFNVDMFTGWLLLITTIVAIVVVSSGQYIKTRHKLFYIFSLLLYLLSTVIVLSAQGWLTICALVSMAVVLFIMIGIWSKAKNYQYATRFIFIQLLGFSFIVFSLFILQFIVLRYEEQPLILQQMMSYVDSYTFLNNSQIGYRNLAFIFMLVGFAFIMPLIGFHRAICDLFKFVHYPVLIAVVGFYLPLIAYCFKQYLYSFFLDYISSIQVIAVGLCVLQITYMAINLWKVEKSKAWIGYVTLANIPIVYILLLSNLLVTVSFALMAIISFMLTMSLLLTVMTSLYERQKTDSLDSLNGLFKVKPYLSSMIIITLLAVTGLPLFSHYFTVFHTFFAVYHLNVYLFIVSLISVFLVAINVFLHMSKLFIKNEYDEKSKYIDLSFSELIAPILLISLVFMLGIYPSVFLERIETQVEQLLDWIYDYKEVIIWDTDFYSSLIIGDTIAGTFQFSVAALAIVTLVFTIWLASKQNQKMIHWVYWSASHFACVGLSVLVVTINIGQAIAWKQLIFYVLSIAAIFVATHFLLSRHMYRSMYEDAVHYEGLYYKNKFMYKTMVLLLLTLIGLPFSAIATLRFEFIAQLMVERYVLLAFVITMSFAFVLRPLWYWIASISFPVIDGNVLNRTEQIVDWTWTKTEKVLVLSSITINIVLMFIYNML